MQKVNTIEILVKIRNEAQKALDELDKSTKEISSNLNKPAGKLISDTEKDAKKAASSLKETAAQVKKTNDALKKTSPSGLKSLAPTLKKIKTDYQALRKEANLTQKASSKLGGAIAGVFAGFSVAKAVQETVKFSKSITEVSTLVDSAVIPTKELSDTVLSLSNEYGNVPTDTAAGLYQAISAGAEAGAEANELLTVALRTAKAGVTTTETAVDGITTVINAFGFEMSQAEQVADVLFATMRNGKTNVGELSRFMSQAAPLASALGVTYEEVTAATIAMTLQGTKTSAAFTGIRAALQGMIKPGGDAEKAFKAVGFESAKAAIASVGFEGALNIISDAAGGSEAKLIQMIGSIEGVQAILQTTGKNSKFLSDGLDQVQNSAGELNTAFGKVEESIGQDYDKAIASATTSMIQFGQAIQPVLTTLFNLVTTGTTSISEFVSEHETLVTVAATAVLGLVAAWGTFKALKLVGQVTGISTAFKLLAAQIGLATIATNSAGVATSRYITLSAGIGKLRNLLPAIVAGWTALDAKLIQSTTNLNILQKGVGGLRTVFSGLFGILASNPITVVLGAAAVAAGLVTKAYIDLKNSEIDLANATARYEASLQQTKQALKDITVELDVYRTGAIKSADEIANLDSRGAAAYEQTLQKVVELQTATKLLGDRQKESGEATVEGYENVGTVLEEAAVSMEQLKARIAAIAEENKKAAESSSTFSAAIQEASIKGKDQVDALKTAFEAFNVLDLDDAKNVINGIGIAADEAFQAVTNSAASIPAALQETLSGKSVEEINKFIANLDQLSGTAGSNTEAIAAANSAAIGALFSKLGVTTQTELAKVDATIADTFRSIVDAGGASTQDLVAVVEANVSKLGTVQGIEDFKVLVTEAMSSAGADTTILADAIDALNAKQDELRQKADGASVSLKDTTASLGVETITQGTTAYTDLATAFASVEDGFKSGSVSVQQYNEGVGTYLQGLRDYLIGVKGVSEEVANAAVQSEANQRGLQAAISETGRVSTVTQQQIVQANNDAANVVKTNTQDIQRLQQESMAATVTLNQEGWSQISETIKGTYDAAVAAEANARAAMTESREAFIAATATGDEEQIAAAKAIYDSDVANFKEAIQEKTDAAREASKAIEDVATAAAESAEKVTASASVNVGDLFAGMRDGSQEAIDQIVANTETALRQIGETLPASYASRAAAIYESQSRAIAAASDELARATAKHGEYKAALESSNVPSRQLISNAENAIRSMRTLDSQKLSSLQASIDQAKQKLDDLYRSAVQTLDGLRSELASLRGNVTEVENIQYRQRVEQIQAQLEAARVAGDAATISALEKSLETLAEIHRTKLRNIANEAAEQKRADEQELARKRALNNANGDGDDIQGFAKGGAVVGAGTGTSDSILARLSNGEFVMDANTVKHFGVNAMKRLQSIARSGFRMPTQAPIRRFAVGGAVGNQSGDAGLAGLGGAVRKMELTLNVGGQAVTGVFEDTEADRLMLALEDAGATSQ